MRNLVIIGAGGHAKVAVDIAEQMKYWDEIAILDDYYQDKTFLGYPLLGKIADAINLTHDPDYFVALGDNKLRKDLIEWLVKNERNPVNLLHPNCVIAKDVVIGCGSILMAGAVVNRGTKIGMGSIINTNANVDHDVAIGEFVHVSPGTSIGGNVIIGDSSWLGIGSTISNNLKICANVIIGAGAVVVKNISVEGLYLGVPARRILRENTDHH